MQAPREGSRKALVFAAFTSNGEKAAYAVAEEQGLKTGTVKSWLGTWLKGELIETKAKPPRIAKAVKEDAKPKSNVSVKWTKRPARLVTKGEQCSEIKWLDTGTYQALPNDQLIFAKQA